MKRISCPLCGLRGDHEFTWGGPADVVRPDTATCTDEEWAAYLFHRDNPRGIHQERWCHTYGCGQWFHAARDTVADRIERIYSISQRPTDAAG